ncbi:UPF0691 protein C9orf116 homolog isoform X2 [Spodoptera litura]|uniref:UPF0691 protein C9orf116 homolog isoform X2 n=1 Tax=Spodoptera litura TaxID=69820 RepID=A0A9J7DRA8_SPOLT|nr:UPF0691 protein C9orf116 homolog isoform X2 [Spodoptera litura]
MAEGNVTQPQEPSLPLPPPPASQPGFCSATCTDKKSAKEEIAKPNVKTSDLFTTCNLPKRFEHPHWFNGYGCQVSKQHPFYRTSSNEYGWYPPGWHSVSSDYFPLRQSFSEALQRSGMFRNYSLNTGADRSNV